MKYLFLMLCLLCIGSSQLRAQGNVLHLTKGDQVFFRIHVQKKAPDIYRVQVPLYVVGTVVSVDNTYERIEIKPAYYLYTCSQNADEWIKTPELLYEKQSNAREVVQVEKWDARTHANYKERFYKVFLWTEDVLETLTRGSFIPASVCPKVITINSQKPRTR